MEIFNARDILKHFNIGSPQVSGPVMVIPLLEKIKNVSPYIPFEDIRFSGTSDYGEMVFYTHPDKPTLVPSGFSIVTKQFAQDHGIVKLSILPAGGGQVTVDSYCIEESQGGYIEEQDSFEFNILPKDVRYETLLKSIKYPKEKERTSFSDLWTAIRRFQSGLVDNKQSAHYTYFLDKYKDRLDKFVAAFESIEDQRGAIIIVNNKIAGIEVVPTREDWEFSYKNILRDGYGTTLVAQELRGGKLNCIKFNYKGTSLSEISMKMQQSDKDLQEMALRKLNKIESSLQVTDEELGYLKILTNNQLVGEIIQLKGSIQYASIYSERY